MILSQTSLICQHHRLLSPKNIVTNETVVKIFGTNSNQNSDSDNCISFSRVYNMKKVTIPRNKNATRYNLVIFPFALGLFMI